jgi:uncharacterized integral membrane protein
MLDAMSAGWPESQHRPPGSGGDPALGPLPGSAPPSHDTKRGTKAVAAAVLLLVLVVFVLRNSQRVSVDFIVTTGHPRLIFVFLVCIILGGVIGFLLGKPVRARRHRSSAGSGDGDVPRL